MVSATPIRLGIDTLLSAKGVADLVPSLRRGRKIHASTFHRWCTRGQGGHVLASVWIGGRRFTSVEALQAFVERLSRSKTPAPAPTQGSPRAATRLESADASRRQRRVEHALERFGL